MSLALTHNTFIRPHINLGDGNDREDGINTLPELIEFAAEYNPNHIFGQQLRANEVKPCIITFSQFATAVKRTTAWLVNVGATTGRTKREVNIPPVALLLGSDITHFMYLCALMRIGTPVLVISASLNPVAILHLLKQTNPGAVLVSSQVSHSINETIEISKNQKTENFVLPKIIDSISYEEFLKPTGVLAEYPIPPKYPVFCPEDLGAFIMHSSGTPGLPKPVLHSQTYPLIVATSHRFPKQTKPFHYLVSTLPLYHGFGLLATMLSLSIGLPFILPPATIIPTGKTTCEMLKSSGARYLISVPSILEDILRLPGRTGLEALRELEVVVYGGAPMKENIGAELVANGVKLLNHWGATEIASIAPIERIPHGEDWHYLMPRTDLGLRYITGGETKEQKRIKTMEEMVEKYREELVSYADLAAEAREKRNALSDKYDPRKVVLLTGSTGSLGCFLLARIASDPSVRRLYCLNRATPGIDVRERQRRLMKNRGAALDEENWAKVEVLESEPSKLDLGLGEAKYNELIGITHVIHNAWPVNFLRNIAYFEPHVKALSNLFRLSIQSAGTRPSNAEPTRVLFTSSIGAASRFPILNPNGPLEIPEIPLHAINTAEHGYSESKWVCESIGLIVRELYGQEDTLIKASTVRIGQMTGPEGSGAWNEKEYFPRLVQSSATLGVVPDVRGSFSWIPVNRAADVITEITFSQNFKSIYHMENPSRQSWESLIKALSSILGGTNPLPIIPLVEWLGKVKVAGKNNPAYKLLNFFEHDFVRIFGGMVVLRTKETKLDSPTLRQSMVIDRKHLEEYIRYWKRIGAMPGFSPHFSKL